MKRLPLHPLLFAAYAVLALLAHNLAQVRLSAGTRPLPVAVAAAGALWLALRLPLRSWSRAAVASTLLVILFFSYGHVYNYLERHAVFGLVLGRHRLLVPLWLGLAAIGLGWVVKKLRDLPTATLALNVVALAALAFPLAQIGFFEMRAASAVSETSAAPVGAATLRLPPGQPPPDVYDVILDAYARSDFLDKEFGFDNSEFLAALAGMGFYVAPCSQSNYAQTELTLTSALNMNYIEALGAPAVPGSQDRSALWPLFRHSAVRRALERLGYRVVAFDSGFYRTQLDDADVYLSPGVTGGMNGFEILLLKTTAGLALTDAAVLWPRALTADVDAQAHRQLRETVLYELDYLPKVPAAIPGPKFVFVHIMAPHEPFVFGPQGEAVDYPAAMSDEVYRQGYLGELRYLNRRVEAALRAVIANSATPPILVIHGDHGAGVTSERGRMSIFNAYYLPGGGSRALYPSISPVNSFRVIFNACFGGQFELLPDVSYFSVYDDPYDFRVIPPEGECGGD